MSEAGLQWTVEERDSVRIVRPAGRVDESTATEFGDRLIAEVGEAAGSGRPALVIDLGGIDYMSSRGLRALTLAQRSATPSGVKIALAEPNEVMREILAISRYDMVFPLFDTAEAAAAGG